MLGIRRRYTVMDGVTEDAMDKVRIEIMTLVSIFSWNIGKFQLVSPTVLLVNG